MDGPERLTVLNSALGAELERQATRWWSDERQGLPDCDSLMEVNALSQTILALEAVRRMEREQDRADITFQTVTGRNKT